MKSVATIASFSAGFLTMAVGIAFGEKINDGDKCVDVVRKIAPHDAEFQSRPAQKNAMFKELSPSKRNSMTPAQISAEINAAIKTPKEWGFCISTKDWLWDLLLGATVKAETTTDAYSPTTISRLKKLFEDHATKDKGRHVVFDFYLDALNAGHAWIVHQFPNTDDPDKSPQYQIYQSFVGIYSLGEWLTPASNKAEAELEKRVTRSYNIRCGLPGKPKECTSHKDLKGLSEIHEKLMRWLNAVSRAADTPEFALRQRLKGEDKPLDAFLPAWRAYGGGQMLSKTQLFGEEADSWLSKLAEVQEWMSGPADKIVTKEEIKQFSDLFAAPPSGVFPGFMLHRFAKGSPPAKLFIRNEVQKAATEADANKACVDEGRRIAVNVLK